MVRETYGRAVDDALAQLDHEGVPREALAALRGRLRRDKALVAVALDVAAGRADLAGLRRAIARHTARDHGGQQGDEGGERCTTSD